MKYLILIILLTSTAYAYSLSGHVGIVGWAYERNESTTGSATYNYTTLLPHISDESKLRLCRWDKNDSRWYAISATHDTAKNTFTTAEEHETYALCNWITNCTEDTRGHCETPSLTAFPGSNTTTITNCLNTALTLHNSTTKVEWHNNISACGEYYSNIRLSNYVSIKADNLDPSIDTPATVTMQSSCPSEIRFNANFSSSKAEVLQGQVCNAGTTPACTNIQCTGNTITFDVEHFGSYAVQSTTDSDGDGVLDDGDSCPDSIPDNIMLAPKHYAQNDADSAFEILGGESSIYTMTTTDGCTCKQIAKALGVGKAAIKKGCTKAMMESHTSLSSSTDQVEEHGNAPNS